MLPYGSSVSSFFAINVLSYYYSDKILLNFNYVKKGPISVYIPFRIFFKTLLYRLLISPMVTSSFNPYHQLHFKLK